jgi:predicted RNase H-like HicB family nuclease
MNTSQKLSKQPKYPKKVFWSEEDEGYIAIAPDLPGSSAFGESEGEALQELDEVIAGWIAATKAVGNPVPPPSTPSKQHSGKLLVRMPRSLHRDLAEDAAREGVSLNQYVVFVLSKRTSARSTLTAAIVPARGHIISAEVGSVRIAAPSTGMTVLETHSTADWPEMLGNYLEAHWVSLNTFGTTMGSQVAVAYPTQSSDE